jgi:SAM-dependent methyltransferase
MCFADHFSRQSAEYVHHRPDYPEALFSWLAACAPRRQRAWDCGCGSGQAAGRLTGYFAHVVATDPSVAQIRHAHRGANLSYAVALAESCPLPDRSIDLVTVAQALHWFDVARFYAEARRVLVPQGVIAVWCYGEVSVDAASDAVIQQFYHDVVGPYWPPQRRHVESGYRDLPFPFARSTVPRFEMAARWTIADLVAYVGTWSATRRYMAATGVNPLPALRQALIANWPDASRRKVSWPLHVLAGTVA